MQVVANDVGVLDIDTPSGVRGPGPEVPAGGIVPGGPGVVRKVPTGSSMRGQVALADLLPALTCSIGWVTIVVPDNTTATVSTGAVWEITAVVKGVPYSSPMQMWSSIVGSRLAYYEPFSEVCRVVRGGGPAMATTSGRVGPTTV